MLLTLHACCNNYYNTLIQLAFTFNVLRNIVFLQQCFQHRYLSMGGVYLVSTRQSPASQTAEEQLGRDTQLTDKGTKHMGEDHLHFA